MNSKWDARFLRVAREVSLWSKDPSTKVGAVIVGKNRDIVSTGYNGIPRGCRDDIPEWHQRPLKYMAYEHGERNSVLNAARRGASTEGCTLYGWWDAIFGPPCADCARAIIQAGIVRVILKPGDLDPAKWTDRWRESAEMSAAMLTQAGVVVAEADLALAELP